MPNKNEVIKNDTGKKMTCKQMDTQIKYSPTPATKQPFKQTNSAAVVSVCFAYLKAEFCWI